MLKRILAVILLTSVFVAIFGGCGAKSSVESIRVAVCTEPMSIDPGLNNTVDSGILIDHCFEGLTAVDRNGRLIPGVAKDWKVSDDGRTYTFNLRDCMWSDGQPVRAQDFEYAWKRLLNPVLASEYAYSGEYLLNGKEYANGIVTAGNVGVRAVDDKTLEVRLKAPTAYFPDICRLTCFYPVRKDIIEKYGDRWTQDPSTYICNGAFKLKEWEHDEMFVVEYNPNYWNRDDIKFKSVEFVLTGDDESLLDDFEAGDLALNYRRIPSDAIPRLVSEGKVTILPDLAVYFYSLDTTKPPLDEVKVRRALSFAIDRKYIVEKILRAGQKPSVGWVPAGIPGQTAGKDFRSEAPAFIKETAEQDEAGRLLAEAGYPGGDGFPEIEVTFNTGVGHKLIAEAIQAMWKQNLGIVVRITEMEWLSFKQKRDVMGFQIAKDGWGADYEDAMTFMDLFVTDGENNNTNWGDPEYDELIEEAQGTIDRKTRLQAMHDAERLLMDAMPVIPIYNYSAAVLIDPELKDCYIDSLGHIYLHLAYMK